MSGNRLHPMRIHTSNIALITEAEQARRYLKQEKEKEKEKEEGFSRP
jgi:hypothetical protein